MTDQTRPSQPTSGNSAPRDSSQGQQKRRRRRSRGKGRPAQGSKPQGEKQPGKQQPGKQGERATETKQAAKPSSSNHRRRRRGGKGQASRPHSKQQQNRRRPHYPNRYDSNIATRDETSAGGLVVSGMAEAVNSGGDVDLSQIYAALIGRLDRRGRLLWSMPKGHVEDGEHQWKTAEREVWEETGIYGEAFDELGTIDYWFVSEGVRIHKTVHHNLLRYVDGELNDEDPEVTEVAWVPMSELIERLAYADERKLARIAVDRMPDLARKERRAGRSTPR